MNRSYDDHPDFNERLDADGEIEIGGVPFRPSAVLFAMDPEAWEAALLDWENQERQARLDALTELRKFRENDRRVDALIEAASRGAIVPFVGAGLTVPCGMPAWTDFLVGVAVHSGLKEHEVRARLKNGEYEEVAEEVMGRLGTPGFNDMFEGKFVLRVTPTGAVSHLPQFASGCVITTNFDDVLERVYEDVGERFVERILGCSQTGFGRALANREHHLLKLHGDVRDSSSRVLTLAEYKSAYGESKIDFKRELPRTLRKAFMSSCLLFLGCRLEVDRTLDLFKEVVDVEGVDDLPKHYAMLAYPGDGSVSDRERFLADRHIFPIWFPPGEYEWIEAVTAVLADV